MAMIACAECGKEISSMAAACPHCGRPTIPSAGSVPLPPFFSSSPGGRAKRWGVILMAVGGLLIVPVLVVVHLVTAILATLGVLTFAPGGLLLTNGVFADRLETDRKQADYLIKAGIIAALAGGIIGGFSLVNAAPYFNAMPDSTAGWLALTGLLTWAGIVSGIVCFLIRNN